MCWAWGRCVRTGRLIRAEWLRGFELGSIFMQVTDSERPDWVRCLIFALVFGGSLFEVSVHGLRIAQVVLGPANPNLSSD